ncbi:MAG TPA: 4-(cytidine 5'-diphospho)-2-C-methyl-D-erythritol kinase [Thermoanaerobaculia bacterium]|jgi:4-diphosphocytidyl-2-C-methyl-D-erythritol kinase
MRQGGPLRAEALAKVNRELRVGPRRADGYHEIRSRFVTVDLADVLEVRDAEAWEFSCAGGPDDESNLAARAAAALAAAAGVDRRGSLSLVKRIPAGAGLGGGSADAAATLAILARLWDASPAPERLSEIAASIGSDVPYFLEGGEADVGGRGERVIAREDDPPIDLTILVPPFPLATSEVYAAFDRAGGAATPPARLAIESSGRFLGPNDLERAVVAVRPEMRDYLEAGRAIARECGVTGSGSAIVLVGAPPQAVADLVARRPGTRALATRTVGRVEYRRRTGISAPGPSVAARA